MFHLTPHSFCWQLVKKRKVVSCYFHVWQRKHTHGHTGLKPEGLWLVWCPVRRAFPCEWSKHVVPHRRLANGESLNRFTDAVPSHFLVSVPSCFLILLLQQFRLMSLYFNISRQWLQFPSCNLCLCFGFLCLCVGTVHADTCPRTKHSSYFL